MAVVNCLVLAGCEADALAHSMHAPRCSLGNSVEEEMLLCYQVRSHVGCLIQEHTASQKHERYEDRGASRVSLQHRDLGDEAARQPHRDGRRLFRFMGSGYVGRKYHQAVS